MDQTLDADTRKELTDGEEVANLLASRGWAIIHDKLVKRVMDLQNLYNLDLEKPDTLSTQVLARTMAATEMNAWYNQDVIGFVEQQQNAAAAMLDKKEDGFINRG
jgi:hypothetical protein